MRKKLNLSRLVVAVVMSLTLTGCFGIGASEPSFEIIGVENNKTYEEPVIIEIIAESGTNVTATLNGESFESGKSFGENGTHTLLVVGKLTNGKGEPVTREITFTIDLKVPLITITGVEEKVYYGESVTPVITTDNDSDILEIKLNGEVWEPGTISELGKYILTVTATNEDDRSYTVELEFEIDHALSHEFSIDEELKGFSIINGATLGYQTEIIRDGELGNLSVETREGQSYSGVWVSGNTHPDWVIDWTLYDKIAAYVYLDEIETIAEGKGIAIRIGDNKGTQVYNLELKEGWNYIEADLLALVGNDATKLENMTGANFQIIADKKGTFIVDDIQLVRDVD